MSSACSWFTIVIASCCARDCYAQSLGGQCQGSLDSTSPTFATCTCDLTSLECDPNCCCDPSCSELDKLAFTSCDVDPTGSQRMCVYDTIVVESLTKEQSVVEASDSGLFCVMSDNNNDRRFYSNPCTPANILDFDSLAESSNDGEYKYAPGLASTIWSQSRCTSVQRSGLSCSQKDTTFDIYRVGNVIYTGYRTSSGVAVPYGVLTVAQPLASGECTDESAAGYFNDESYSCTRQLATDSSFCGNASRFDVTTYLTPLLLARPKRQTTMVPIACASITVRDGNGNDIVTEECTNTSRAFALSCNSTIVENLVQEVHYVIHRNFLGISGASASFVVRAPLLVADMPDALVQSHTIRFQGDAAAASDAAQVNVYPRSGYPGYITGKPVLAGRSVEGAVAADVAKVDISVDPATWLTLPKPSFTSECADITTTSTVAFGVDMVIQCAIPTTFEDYKDTASCTRLRETALDIFSTHIPTHNVLGMYGNSSQLDLVDWVPLLDRDTSAWASFSGTDSNNQCLQVATAVDLQILTARIGNIDNAQHTIVGARYKPTHTTQTFSCTGSLCNPAVPAAQRQQTLLLRFSVAFLDVTSNLVEVRKNEPDVIGKLPHDFFYPFE
eukprot:m.1301952 g.1301952  ORF g.1301952 m.1301952 type:complete len:615 (+) comp24807_c1_seq6:299-2143(+)